jgi:hypothetical protein
MIAPILSTLSEAAVVEAGAEDVAVEEGAVEVAVAAEVDPLPQPTSNEVTSIRLMMSIDTEYFLFMNFSPYYLACFSKKTARAGKTL